jgi:tetratricopeptide (TPR) repeat protein
VREYEIAERLAPDLLPLVLNKGLACQQLMAPGAKSSANNRWVECALAAFKRMMEVAPQDPRGEQLYVQTLFDADRFPELVERYQRDLRADPKNLAAINGLVQVYTRWDHWDDALKWMMRRADVAAHDAEAQYGVGVFIWSRLFQRGGSGEKASFDPRADPKQPPPPFGDGDIVGVARIQLADLGIRYLERALAIRPNYRDAMVYSNLLYRQKSFALFEQPDEWKAAMDAALRWQEQAIKTDGGKSGAGGGAGH